MAAGSAFASGENKESKVTIIVTRKIDIVRYFFKEFSLLLSAIVSNVRSRFKISGIIFYLGFHNKNKIKQSPKIFG
jgi:hypothetical protein